MKYANGHSGLYHYFQISLHEHVYTILSQPTEVLEHIHSATLEKMKHHAHAMARAYAYDAASVSRDVRELYGWVN